MKPLKTYTVTYQSQGVNLREARRNLLQMLKYGYGKEELIEEMVGGLKEEKPTKPPRKPKVT